ncbi:MAG: carbohydrate ABC transporter permease [Sphaerochaetaceae bacterium]|nr:carbohydrate ABC transporter permease [Sphaerochaetaceae bacterium]MDD3670385.1 carbohydrate ABC transporter permease [Sphaerochaetaceae bacterium]MDD4258645.1 carbohydrate ABC transporter permease [Sphaerochaetaceae bacterium]
MLMKKSLLPWKIFAYSIMILFTILAIAPLLWLLVSSFKPHVEIVRNPLSIPQSWYVENFSRAWTQGSLGIYFFNSILYSAIATSITTLFALGAGYTFAKFNYRISKFFYALYTLGLLITVHSVIVPLFILETNVGIDNSRLGVIIPYIAFGLPFAVYLATGFLKGIPDSLEEAALIDGATYLQIFRHIIIPVATPIIATMFIYTFLSNWNEFVLVLTLTSKSAIRSLPVGINSFAGGMSRDYGLQFAALVIGTIPMIVFYLIFHEYLEKGFAAGVSKE